MEDFAVFGKSNGASGFNGAANIIALNVALALPEGDSAAAVDALDVAAGNAENRGFDGNAGGTFGFLDGAANANLP